MKGTFEYVQTVRRLTVTYVSLGQPYVSVCLLTSRRHRLQQVTDFKDNFGPELNRYGLIAADYAGVTQGTWTAQTLGWVNFRFDEVIRLIRQRLSCCDPASAGWPS